MKTKPNDSLLREVRAGLTAKGSSLHRYMIDKDGRSPQYARAVLLGRTNGEAARALRARLAEAAGVSYQEAA